MHAHRHTHSFNLESEHICPMLSDRNKRGERERQNAVKKRTGKKGGR